MCLSKYVFIHSSSRRWLRGQTSGHPVAQPHLLREAQHRDEGHRLRVGTEGRDQGARPDRVLGSPDHILHLGPSLPKGVLLDLQVRNHIEKISVSREFFAAH